MEEKKICGLCNQPLDDGKHKLEWVEVRDGIKMQNCDCPYYVGFNGRPAIFIPKNNEEEKILKELKEDLHKREEMLTEMTAGKITPPSAVLSVDKIVE